MLYLEDYLEMIEHLPQELRDRFTEMRELDLSVQNNMDDLEKRVKVLFNEWKRNPNDLPPNADLEFEGIKKEYSKTLEDQDEKVVLANQMYELVDRYLRRLDTELHKFKCELEADNKGITELLEKRSLELDTPITSTTSSQKENRYERYSSSRPREKRRSDSCQTSGGVCYPEKRPHLSHSLSMSATNGNNVLLTSQLQAHSLHGITTQSHQLANASNNSTTLHTSNNSSYLNSNSTSISSNSSSNLQSLTSASSSSSSSQQLINSTNQSSLNSLQSSTAAPSINNHQQQTSQSTAATTSLCSAGNAHVAVSGTPAVTSSAGAGGYTLVSGGAGPAIAAAASQAIAATQKMQQGRRTPSLKASYEAINSTGSGGLMKVNDMAIGRELAGAAQTAIQAIQHDSNKKKAANKKYSSSSSSHHSSGSSSLRQQSMGGGASTSSMGGASTNTQSLQHNHQMDLVGDVDGYNIDMGAASGMDDISGAGTGAVDGAAEDLGVAGEYIDTYDPNEPRYCLCNQVSYGDMVACDNEDCPSEWFHYPCVGITAPPKGKWYCPQCTSSMRRRGSRKN